MNSNIPLYIIVITLFILCIMFVLPVWFTKPAIRKNILPDKHIDYPSSDSYELTHGAEQCFDDVSHLSNSLVCSSLVLTLKKNIYFVDVSVACFVNNSLNVAIKNYRIAVPLSESRQIAIDLPPEILNVAVYVNKYNDGPYIEHNLYTITTADIFFLSLFDGVSIGVVCFLAIMLIKEIMNDNGMGFAFTDTYLLELNILYYLSGILAFLSIFVNYPILKLNNVNHLFGGISND